MDKHFLNIPNKMLATRHFVVSVQNGGRHGHI